MIKTISVTLPGVANTCLFSHYRHPHTKPICLIYNECTAVVKEEEEKAICRHRNSERMHAGHRGWGQMTTKFKLM